MASDLENLLDDLAGGENRLGTLVRRMNTSLAEVVERTGRLTDGFRSLATAGGPTGTNRATGLPDPPTAASPGQVRTGPGTAESGSPRDAVAAGNARANEQTARAVEELVRHGIRLRDAAPAVYAE